MAFGAVFEPDIGNSVSKRMNCHRPLARRSCSKVRYVRYEMNNTDIYDLILRYRKLIYEGRSSTEENEKELIKLLDELAYSQHMIQNSFDENDYPDPPKANYLKIGELISNRFPSFARYDSENALVLMECISEITADIDEVYWRWENTSEVDAVRNFRFGFCSH